ncbi:MAG: mandelate racemase/muconate lactonizing enzyme family protein [Anaerolineae bacterium]|nr:mandelate racemase/muconate lactonizing enzyme family protein [Anaerolineae bacterium]
MKLQSLQSYIFSVPAYLRTALSNTKFSSHCVIVLGVDGVDGYGSGVLYRTRPLEAMHLLRREIIPFLETAAFGALGDLRAQIRQAFSSRIPSVVYALDSALWDVEAKVKGKPVNQLLGTPLRKKVDITEQVFIAHAHRTRQELAEILSHGTKRIKVKIGSDPVADVERVRLIREAVGAEVSLGVDINGGYTFEQALDVGEKLAEIGVSVFEDPVAVREWHRLPSLRKETGIPIMQDAGIHSADDLRRAIDLGAVDLLNLKLTRVGGLTGAIELARICEQHGVRPAVGCSEDLGPGMASILHLASVLAALHSTEGVGSYRLGFDIIDEDWHLHNGALDVPQERGLGVHFSEERMRKAARARSFVVGDVQAPSVLFIAGSGLNKWYQRCFTLQWRLQRAFRILE